MGFLRKILIQQEEARAIELGKNATVVAVVLHPEIGPIVAVRRTDPRKLDALALRKMLEVVRRETRLGGHGRVVVIYVTILGIHHTAAHHIPVIYVARGVVLNRVIRGVIHVIVVRKGIEIQKNLLETKESEDLASSELPKSGCLLPMASEKVLMTQ